MISWCFFSTLKEGKELYRNNDWSTWDDKWKPVASNDLGDLIIIDENAIFEIAHDTEEPDPVLITKDLEKLEALLKDLIKYKGFSEKDTIESLKTNKQTLKDLKKQAPKSLKFDFECEINDIQDAISDKRWLKTKAGQFQKEHEEFARLVYPELRENGRFADVMVLRHPDKKVFVISGWLKENENVEDVKKIIDKYPSPHPVEYGKFMPFEEEENASESGTSPTEDALDEDEREDDFDDDDDFIEATQDMYKVGDWIHTSDGIGRVACVFPHYYQYWEKTEDDKYRLETYGDNEKLANSLLGKRKNVGDWVKDIVYMKRLCDHDAIPKKRVMCFHGVTYANDTISKKEMAAVNKALKDQKLRDKFEKYACKYARSVRAWNIHIPVTKAVEIQKALCSLEHNSENSLIMTMKEVEHYFKDNFQVDLFETMDRKIFDNTEILTQLRSENDEDYYNENRQEIITCIEIMKKDYDEEYLEKLINAHDLDSSLYDLNTWLDAGWIEND